MKGFTLLELLAVMAILAILASVSIVGFQKFQARGEERKVEALITQLASLAEGEYETAKGDYPPDDYSGLAARGPNDKNVGIESFVASVAQPAAPWPLPDERHLANVDGDKFPKKVTSYGTLDAFELVDGWGNPLAYFHAKSYGKPQKVTAKRRETGELEDQEVRAVMNPKTQLFHHPESFQLISAGRDGVFGTEDDLANFER